MRKMLLLLMIFCAGSVLGQTSTEAKYNATFMLPGYVNNGKVDSVFIFNIKTKTQIELFNMKHKDRAIVLHNLKTGKYLLTLKGTNYLIEEYPFVICSKCNDTIDLSKVPNQRAYTSVGFNLVSVGPGYVGGDAQLKNDFLSNYSKEEIQILKSIKQFKIEAFLTITLEVCDISFIEINFDESSNEENDMNGQKELLVRGLRNLKNWHSARTNGQPVDGKFILENFHLKGY